MFGVLGKLTHRDGKAQCHICGTFFGHLGGHVKRKHGIESNDYKKEFGLKITTGLIGKDLIKKRRKNTEHLKKYKAIGTKTLKNLTLEQRQKRYVSLEEKRLTKDARLESLEKARTALLKKYRQKTKKFCSNCQKSFSVPKHNKNKNKKKFCSAECYFTSDQKKEAGHRLRKHYGCGKVKTP